MCQENDSPVYPVLLFLLYLLFRAPANPEERKKRDLMVQESQILKQLQSTHIIHYHDLVVEGNKLYIVMEYAPNGTLTELLDV